MSTAAAAADDGEPDDDEDDVEPRDLPPAVDPHGDDEMAEHTAADSDGVDIEGSSPPDDVGPMGLPPAAAAEAGNVPAARARCPWLAGESDRPAALASGSMLMAEPDLLGARVPGRERLSELKAELMAAELHRPAAKAPGYWPRPWPNAKRLSWPTRS